MGENAPGTVETPVAAPQTVPSNPTPTPSGLEKGADLVKQSIHDAETVGDFTIKCAKVSKNGSYSILEGEFCESHLDHLIDHTASESIRLIIAQQMGSKDTAGLRLNYEEKLFRKSRYFGFFDQEGFHQEFQKRLWGERDIYLCRQFLRYDSYNRFCAFPDFFELWGLEKEDISRSNSKISYLWLNQLPNALIGTYLIENSDSSNHLGIILFPPQTYTSGYESVLSHYARWIYNERFNSATRHSDGTLETMGRLILLDFMVYLTTKWIQGLRRINETIQDSNLKVDADGLPTMRDFTHAAASLQERIHLLLESLNLSTSVPFYRSSSKPLDLAAEELSNRASHISRAAIDLQAVVTAYFNVQITRANLRESRAVKRLAVLATVFLPLSLGAGILSMQNRFTSIHLVLWDYAAVCIDLSVIVVTLFWITSPSKLPRLGAFVLDKLLYVEGKKKRKVWRIVKWSLALPALAVIFIAFNVGMFGSVDLAWKILAYGVGGSGAIMIIGGALYVAFSFLWKVFDDFDNWEI